MFTTRPKGNSSSVSNDMLIDETTLNPSNKHDTASNQLGTVDDREEETANTRLSQIQAVTSAHIREQEDCELLTALTNAVTANDPQLLEEILLHDSISCDLALFFMQRNDAFSNNIAFDFWERKIKNFSFVRNPLWWKRCSMVNTRHAPFSTHAEGCRWANKVCDEIKKAEIQIDMFSQLLMARMQKQSEEDGEFTEETNHSLMSAEINPFLDKQFVAYIITGFMHIFTQPMLPRGLRDKGENNHVYNVEFDTDEDGDHATFSWNSSNIQLCITRTKYLSSGQFFYQIREINITYENNDNEPITINLLEEMTTQEKRIFSELTLLLKSLQRHGFFFPVSITLPFLAKNNTIESIREIWCLMLLAHRNGERFFNENMLNDIADYVLDCYHNQSLFEPNALLTSEYRSLLELLDFKYFGNLYDIVYGRYQMMVMNSLLPIVLKKIALKKIAERHASYIENDNDYYSPLIHILLKTGIILTSTQFIDSSNNNTYERIQGYLSGDLRLELVNSHVEFYKLYQPYFRTILGSEERYVEYLNELMELQEELKKDHLERKAWDENVARLSMMTEAEQSWYTQGTTATHEAALGLLNLFNDQHLQTNAESMQISSTTTTTTTTEPKNVMQADVEQNDAKADQSNNVHPPSSGPTQDNASSSNVSIIIINFCKQIHDRKGLSDLIQVLLHESIHLQAFFKLINILENDLQINIPLSIWKDKVDKLAQNSASVRMAKALTKFVDPNRQPLDHQSEYKNAQAFFQTQRECASDLETFQKRITRFIQNKIITKNTPHQLFLALSSQLFFDFMFNELITAIQAHQLQDNQAITLQADNLTFVAKREVKDDNVVFSFTNSGSNFIIGINFKFHISDNKNRLFILHALEIEIKRLNMKNTEAFSTPTKNTMGFFPLVEEDELFPPLENEGDFLSPIENKEDLSNQTINKEDYFDIMPLRRVNHLANLKQLLTFLDKHDVFFPPIVMLHYFLKWKLDNARDYWIKMLSGDQWKDFYEGYDDNIASYVYDLFIASCESKYRRLFLELMRLWDLDNYIPATTSQDLTQSAETDKSYGHKQYVFLNDLIFTLLEPIYIKVKNVVKLFGCLIQCGASIFETCQDDTSFFDDIQTTLKTHLAVITCDALYIFTYEKAATYIAILGREAYEEEKKRIRNEIKKPIREDDGDEFKEVLLNRFEQRVRRKLATGDSMQADDKYNSYIHNKSDSDSEKDEFDSDNDEELEKHVTTITINLSQLSFQRPTPQPSEKGKSSSFQRR